MKWFGSLCDAGQNCGVDVQAAVLSLGMYCIYHFVMQPAKSLVHFLCLAVV